MHADIDNNIIVKWRRVEGGPIIHQVSDYVPTSYFGDFSIIKNKYENIHKRYYKLKLLQEDNSDTIW